MLLKEVRPHRLGASGFFLFTRFTQQEIADTYRTLLEHVAAHALKPAIDRVYPLDQAAEAQRRVVADRPFDRVFLDPQT